jgi:hypothetical protein
MTFNPQTTWRYSALTETGKMTSTGIDQRVSQEDKAEAQVGCTLLEGATLELLDDGTLQVRNRHTDLAVNLGQAHMATKAMREALDRLAIHHG